MPTIPIVCYYSFKGGVGRSLAIHATALRLARIGKRVLLVDGDLEAPGLSLCDRFQVPAADQKGLVELLEDLQEPGRGTRGIHPVPIPDPHTPLRPGGALLFLPAGHLKDGRYTSRLAAFSLGTVFQERREKAFFDALKAVLVGEGGWDVVLVDLRTGVDDLSMQLVARVADLLVAVAGLNEQNLKGMRGFLGAIEKAGRKPPILRVASPVPTSEMVLRKSRLAAFEEALGGRPDALLHYHPTFGLTEDLLATSEDHPLHGEHLALVEILLDRLGWGPADLRLQVLDAWTRFDFDRFTDRFLDLSATAPATAAAVLGFFDLGRTGAARAFLEAMTALGVPPPQVQDALAARLGELADRMEAKDLAAVQDLFEMLDRTGRQGARFRGDHAALLQRRGLVEGDPALLDTAESLFRACIAENSRDAVNRARYALFLDDVRNDENEAARMYTESIEIGPSSAEALAGHSRLCFRQGRPEVGSPLLASAFQAGPRRVTLAALWFLVFLYDAERRAEAITALRDLLREGTRVRWALERDVGPAEREAAAAPERYPSLPLLRDLARVLQGHAPPAILEEHAAWRAPSRT